MKTLRNGQRRRPPAARPGRVLEDYHGPRHATDDERQPKSMKKYIKDSVKTVTKHKMCRNIRMLQNMIPSRNQAIYKTALKKFNDEHIAIQTACKKKCRKISRLRNESTLAPTQK